MAASSVTTPVLLLLLLSTAAATFAESLQSNEEVRRLHKEWMARNGRSYITLSEEKSRFKIFRDNLRYINERNAAADRGEHNFRLGLTRFADLTNEEYRTTHLGLQTPDPSVIVSNKRYRPLATDDLPDSIDWREKGAVTAIKDQGKCGSCWVFSSVSTVESINKIVTGNLITLSEQHVLDCTSLGCNGGSQDKAFDYIIADGGLASEEDYPYKGIEGTCNSLNVKRVATIDSYEYSDNYDEQALKKAVANQPVSVAVESAGADFQLYTSGIFEGNCSTNLDHAVAVVGYGTENGKDYWIMRNSWGATGWGEDGYMRIERNVEYSEGKCGIAMMLSYPLKSPELVMPGDAARSINA